MSEFQSGTGPTHEEVEQIRGRIAKGDNGYSGPWYLDLRDLLAAYDVMKQQRDEAVAKVQKVSWVHCWTNEDGKRFLFADDVAEALGIYAPVSEGS